MDANVIHASFGRVIWTRTLPREGWRFCVIPNRRLTVAEKQSIKMFCHIEFDAPTYHVDDDSDFVGFLSLHRLWRFMQEFNKPA